MISCAIDASAETRRNYDSMGFAPLFKRSSVEIDQLHPEMRKFFDSYNVQPAEQLTVGYTSDEILLLGLDNLNLSFQ